MLRRLMVPFSLALVPVPVGATEWVKLGQGVEGGFEAYYDASRMRRVGRNAIVWTRSLGMRPRPNVSYVVAQVQIDCVSETARTLTIMAHSKEDRIVEIVRPDAERDPIPPGSVFERLMRAACR